MDLNEAQGWRPEPGAVLVGTVTEIDAGWSDYTDSSYPIVTVQPEDGSDPVAVHCFHAVLRKRLMSLRPNVGERIGIKFHGTRKSQDGKRDVSVYTVRMDRQQDASTVWDRMGSPMSTRAPQRASQDVPADTSDFTPAGTTAAADDDDDIPF